jgi:cell shape-determining protein MreC
MKIMEHLKTLDGLIVAHTTPPATSKLRNYLSTIIEQAETEGDLPDVIAKKDADHAQTMSALQNENAALKDRLANNSGWKALEKEAADYQAMLRSKQLKNG